MFIYIDGKAFGVISEKHSELCGKIGTYYNGGEPWGVAADLRIYLRQLSLDEVRRLAFRPVGYGTSVRGLSPSTPPLSSSSASSFSPPLSLPSLLLSMSRTLAPSPSVRPDALSGVLVALLRCFAPPPCVTLCGGEGEGQDSPVGRAAGWIDPLAQVALVRQLHALLRRLHLPSAGSNATNQSDRKVAEGTRQRQRLPPSARSPGPIASLSAPAARPGCLSAR